MIFSSDLHLKPKLVFAISLLYMASADGKIEQEELTYLSTVLHGDTEIILQANKYIKNAMKKGQSFTTFLAQSNQILSDEQKECIVINLVDMMLADNDVDENEEKLLNHIIEIYGFDKEKFFIYQELMSKKNNHKVFELTP